MSGSNTEMTTPDWSDNAVNNCHIWSNTSASNENCPLADAQCTVWKFSMHLLSIINIYYIYY